MSIATHVYNFGRHELFVSSQELGTQKTGKGIVQDVRQVDCKEPAALMPELDSVLIRQDCDDRTAHAVPFGIGKATHSDLVTWPKARHSLPPED
jgi:hypothetical protein